MASDLLIVHKKIVPDYLEKVIETRELLQNREAQTVTEAVRMTGISRNTYYKYKDHVWRSQEISSARKAIVSLLLKDEPGSLSEVLTLLSREHLSVITISQTVPVAARAAVIIAADVSGMNISGEQLIRDLQSLPSVLNAQLDAME